MTGSRPTAVHAIIRADAGTQLGMGHVVRCLALARALRARGVRSTFVTAAPAAAVRTIRSAGCSVIAMPRGLHWKRQARLLLSRQGCTGACIAVVDSYELGRPFQTALRSAGMRVCVVEDFPRGPLDADVVIDQGIAARRSDHPSPRARYLLGPRYALVRPAFARRRSTTPRRSRRLPRILVMMGGSDPTGVTFRVLTALDSLAAAFALDVVAGPAFRQLARLSQVVASARHAITLHHHPRDVAGLMARAQLAVSAAGGTCWELACLGTPCVLLVTASNQARNAADLGRSGFAINLGRSTPFPEPDLRRHVARLLADDPLCRQMAARGRALVDGLGARRVAAELMEFV